MANAKPGTLDRLKLLHGTLSVLLVGILNLKPQLDECSADTVFAVGEAAGVVSRAKALLGRDIDEVIKQTGEAT